MLSAELDYDLPPQLIAQEPVQPRDAARLMRLQRDSGTLAHFRVRDLPRLLRPDDLLVFNDTRVLRARLRGFKSESGGRVEAILLREIETNRWEVLLKPSARLRQGTSLTFVSPDETLQVKAEPLLRTEIGWELRFWPDQSTLTDIRSLLPQLGEVPLPPYIHQAAPESDYQTIYARQQPASDVSQGVALDSAAAPTAGLHFTPRLWKELNEQGVQTAFVTLGVGIGTFRPMQSEVLEEHSMHQEEFEVDRSAAQLINAQKARGGRVIAVGTTTTRVLESVADENGQVREGIGNTSIFIRPGYRFRCVDAMMTNFHLPRSTLLAMVSAFAENGQNQSTLTGLDKIRYAYREAIAQEYRFFSFGDAMLIE
jgi:S-adenosylmethionine:tRNA ribosyltransferase-isomerase